MRADLQTAKKPRIIGIFTNSITEEFQKTYPNQSPDQSLSDNEIFQDNIEIFAEKVAKAKASQAEAKSKYNIETADPDPDYRTTLIHSAGISNRP